MPKNQIGWLYLKFNRNKMGQGDTKITIKEGELQKFGKVQYLVPLQPSNPVRMRVSLEVNREEQDLQEWREKVQRLRKKPGIFQFLVLPLEIEENGCFICTTGNKKGMLTMYYEKINMSLHQVIKNRRQFKKYFTQNQIWYLLYVLVKVAAHFEQQSDYLGNIHTTNVLLNDKSRIRIFTLYSSPSQLQNITKIKQSRHMDTFIAPEEIRFIHEDSFACINDCNRNKIDLFNIGLVLISTLTLKDCYHMYNRTLFQLNEEKLIAAIEEMKTTHLNVRYSANLVNMVEACLVFDPLLRKTPRYYYDMLKKNEVKILELQKFQVEIPMVKGQSSVISQEAGHFLQKTSPSTRQSKYLSLVKRKLLKKVEKEPQKNVAQPQGRKEQVKGETNLTRKLFDE